MVVVSVVDDRLEKSSRHRGDARSARAGVAVPSCPEEAAMRAFDE
jgi:hypothetical protein